MRRTTHCRSCGSVEDAQDVDEDGFCDDCSTKIEDYAGARRSSLLQAVGRALLWAIASFLLMCHVGYVMSKPKPPERVTVTDVPTLIPKPVCNRSAEPIYVGGPHVSFDYGIPICKDAAVCLSPCLVGDVLEWYAVARRPVEVEKEKAR